MAVAVGDENYREVQLHQRDLPDPQGIEFTGCREIELPAGVTRIRLKTVEYHPDAKGPFILSTMDSLTKGLRVEVHGAGLAFDGDVIGLGERDDPTPLPDGIRLHYPGWLLEDHGYVVFWHPKG